MKTEFAVLSLLILLFVTTSSVGQTIYTWTGAANGTNMSTPGNWTTNGVDPATTLPNGNNGLGDGFQDIARWDGRTATNLVLRYNTSWPSTGFGSFGVNLVMTANQTNDVQITTSLATSAGMAVCHVTNHSPNAAFIMGDTSNNNWLVFGRPAGAVHHYVNNSTAPAIINPSVKFQAGGGSGYTYAFGGTGDWMVNSFLMPDANAFSPSPVTVNGPGTMLWFGGRTGGYSPNSALGTVTVNGGVLILKTNGLFTGTANQAIVNHATLIYDAVGAQSLIGVISGNGGLIVTNGTLTLGGQSIYTGNTRLKGGTLVVHGAEHVGISGPLGVGGVISFEGGTLQFSTNNIFDYSARFSTAPGQHYKINTAGLDLTLATGLGSSGGALTKLGNGTLTLAGPSTYTGATTVSAGRLVFQSTKSGSGDITVADSAIIGIPATGTPVTPGTLTVSAGAILEFHNVNSTTTAPMAAGAVSASGAIKITIVGGAFSLGESYPLFTWAAGDPPAVGLGAVDGAWGNLTTNGNTIQFNALAPVIWTGDSNGTWDTSTMGNWVQNDRSVIFTNGSPVLFDDSVSGVSNVTVNALVQPSTLMVSNNTVTYSITSSGGNSIAGNMGLTKKGAGTLVLLGGDNSYTGGTTISGGLLSMDTLANGGLPSAIGSSSSGAANLVLNGGTLRYTGGATTSDRSFTVGLSGGAIEAWGFGALNLNNSSAPGSSGSGPRTLTLAGASADDNLLAAPLADHGGATALTKSGAGKWVLTGANTYSGVTTIANGILQVGAGGASGCLGSGNILNEGTLAFNRSDSLTNFNAISGSGSVTKVGAGTLILAGDCTYAGGTFINGGTLQVGYELGGGALGSGPVHLNGTLIFGRRVQSVTWSNLISGTGSLVVNATSLTLTADNTYSGGTTINSGNITLTLGNGGDTGKLNPDASVVNHGSLAFNSSAAFTFNGSINGAGALLKYGSGTLTLTATNTYRGNTIVYGGSLIINGSNAPTDTFVYGGNLGGTGTLWGVVVEAGGTLSPGGAGSIGTLRVGSLWMQGNVTVEVNKLLSPSNDFVAVAGTLSDSGVGKITVTNLGPALAVGDKFTLFSQPLLNSSTMIVTGAGATWANNLATDGSISVIESGLPLTLNFTQSGSNLQFSWDTNLGSYKLQAQTNDLIVGLGNSWADYPGGTVSPVTVPIDPANETVFFRLAPTGRGASLSYDQQSATNDTVDGLLGAGLRDNQPFGQSFVPTLSSMGFIRLYLANPDFGNHASP